MAGSGNLLDAGVSFRVLYVRGTYGHRSETVARVHPCPILRRLMMDIGSPILPVGSADVVNHTVSQSSQTTACIVQQT